MASPTAVTLCKRFTNKYVPVVIGLRANNVRPQTDNDRHIFIGKPFA